MRLGTIKNYLTFFDAPNIYLDQKRNDRDMGLGPFHRAEGVLQMGFQK